MSIVIYKSRAGPVRSGEMLGRDLVQYRDIIYS
jgi:hypothetical protein